MELIDDQPCTPIPKTCLMWIEQKRGYCIGKVKPTDGFYKCRSCGVSYGPVAESSQGQDAGGDAGKGKVAELQAVFKRWNETETYPADTAMFDIGRILESKQSSLGQGGVHAD
jgi:hypothetical protein